jgi:hypothetical protein
MVLCCCEAHLIGKDLSSLIQQVGTYECNLANNQLAVRDKMCTCVCVRVCVPAKILVSLIIPVRPYILHCRHTLSLGMTIRP